MKTVIDELIEQLGRTIPEVKNGNAIDKAYWKEKEKKQIIEAYESGVELECRSGEDFYMQKQRLTQ